MSGLVATSLTTSFPSESDTLQDKGTAFGCGLGVQGSHSPAPRGMSRGHEEPSWAYTHWYNLRAALTAGSTKSSGTAAFRDPRWPSTWFMISISFGDSVSFSPSTTPT